MKEEVSLFLSMFLCGWAQTDNEPDKEENLLHTNKTTSFGGPNKKRKIGGKGKPMNTFVFPQKYFLCCTRHSKLPNNCMDQSCY